MDGPLIDLGKPAGDAGQPKQDGLIKDTDTQGFMADVIEVSRQVPVIVDFWAPWCGPCKQLTPALENAVNEAKGRVRLVKVNVDENQALAGQMRIQSLPAVYAFVNGQPVDGFMGALPDSEIKEFISKVAGPAKEDQMVEELIAAGRTALGEGDVAGAAQVFAQALQIDRECTPALAGLCKCQIESGDLDSASATLALVPNDKTSDPEIISVTAALELAGTPVDDNETARLREAVNADPADFQARVDLACALNASGAKQDALDNLMEVIKADRSWNDEAARKQLLKFFEAWGPADALTLTGRRQLSSVLFS